MSISWRRVLVEGSVIVASILLAFGIDAWWDARQERKEELALLTALEADFTATVRSIDQVVERHRLFAERAAALKTMSESEIRALDTGAVDDYDRALGQYMTFEPRGGTLGTMLAGNQLVMLRDLELRGLITEWFQLLEDAQEEAGFLVRTSERMVLKQSEMVDVTQPLSGEGLVTVVRSPEFMALARAKLFFGTLYQNDLRRLSAHGDSILAALQRERR